MTIMVIKTGKKYSLRQQHHIHVERNRLFSDVYSIPLQITLLTFELQEPFSRQDTLGGPSRW